MSDKWIQKAVGNEGRVSSYLYRVYGDEAFFEDGTIKLKYLRKAVKRIKEGEGHNYDGLLQALYLAIRLKKMERNK